MNKQTVRLGDLINALYDAARAETQDDRAATCLAALSTIDLLLHSHNERLAALLLVD